MDGQTDGQTDWFIVMIEQTVQFTQSYYLRSKQNICLSLLNLISLLSINAIL